MKNLLLPLFLLPFLVSAQSQFWQHRLKVDVSAAGSQDQTFIYFSDQATDNFDPVWDSYKTPSAAGQPTLYTRIAGNTGILSINALSVDYLGNPITLGLQPGAVGSQGSSDAGEYIRWILKESSMKITTFLSNFNLEYTRWEDYNFSSLYRTLNTCE